MDDNNTIESMLEEYNNIYTEAQNECEQIMEYARKLKRAKIQVAKDLKRKARDKCSHDNIVAMSTGRKVCNTCGKHVSGGILDNFYNDTF